jgi:ankyrin repeat protein
MALLRLLGHAASMNTQTHPIAISAMHRQLLALLLAATTVAAAAPLAGCGDGADPETRRLQLLEVAEQGDVSALDALLERTRTADVRDSCDWTPLMKAAVNGHVEAARRLLAAGAAVEAADKGGYTPLLLAASNNHTELVRLLLDHGAMIDAQEQTQGYTPLIWAAHRGHADTVSLLLARGADVTLPDFEGHDAAWHAAEQGHPGLASMLAPATATAQAAAG